MRTINNINDTHDISSSPSSNDYGLPARVLSSNSATIAYPGNRISSIPLPPVPLAASGSSLMQQQQIFIQQQQLIAQQQQLERMDLAAQRQYWHSLTNYNIHGSFE
jgi:hypothetical protein